MLSIASGKINLHVRDDGPADGQVVMFSNSLGTDARVWELMLEHLPEGLRIIRYDKRGHGLSDCPNAPYTMDELVSDAEAIADKLQLKNITFVGLSIGGMIGQGLAARRPDLIRSLVLMDTSAKIGTAATWNERIEALRQGGLTAMADLILDRWFEAPLRNDGSALAPWRNMLERTPLEGYVGCCAAIANADLTDSTSKLVLPVLALVGESDTATPPVAVEETARLCGAGFHVIEGAGHLPCVEQPVKTAALISEFITRVGNV